MLRQSFTSTTLAEARYNPEERILDLRFATGRTYRYFAVPAPVFDALCAAESAGGFFNGHIRDRYDYRRLTGLTPSSS